MRSSHDASWTRTATRSSTTTGVGKAIPPVSLALRARLAPQARQVLNQVAAGVAVRMAALYELLGGADEMPLTRVREGAA